MSFDDLYEAAQEHAASAGYAFTVERSKKKNGRIVKTLSCKRGGHSFKPIDEKTRKRQRTSFKIDCPFRIYAKERLIEEGEQASWELCHCQTEETQYHNHPPGVAQAFFEHRSRELTPTAVETVVKHHINGISTSRTASVFRSQNEGSILAHRDIYNVIAKHNRTIRGNRSPPEALIRELEVKQAAGKVIFEYERDKEGHISRLFVADSRSIDYLNQHPDILLLDCTYKTNKFDMPLVDVLGVDNMGKSFSVAFAFLDSEIEENYLAVVRKISSLYKEGLFPSIIGTDCELALLRAIDLTFPAIRTKRFLCFWHISKNVLVNCKGKFPTLERWEEFSKGFAAVVHASTDWQYLDLLEEFQDEFHWNNGELWSIESTNASPEELQVVATKNLEREAVVYVMGQWLNPYSQYFVRAWVDQYFNGGLGSTSRLEGAHHILKNWIGKPTKDLTRVWQSIQLAIDSQLNEIMAKKHHEAQVTPASLSGRFYYQLISKITHFGLHQLRKQYELFQRYQSEDQPPACTHSWRYSIGIPCWHIIQEREANNQGKSSTASYISTLLIDIIAFTPFDFHPHWHLTRPAPGYAYELPPIPILDPISRQLRRTREAEQRALSRQHNRQVLAESGRILSQFERLPRESIRARLAHCSSCTPYNHDRKRCVGCRHTGHNRSNCPFPSERTTAMPRVGGMPLFQGQNQLSEPPSTLQLSSVEGEDLEVIPGTQY